MSRIASESQTAALAHRDYKSRRRFANLDGLRFFCIAAVIWHHATPIDDPDLLIAHRGFLGVDFFFVLSGFLITTLLLREKERSGAISLRGFYWRRILRICPPYFLLVTGVVAYYLLVRHDWQYLSVMPAYYLFLADFLTNHIPTLGHTWSLSVEEQYYLIWPMLMILAPRRFLIAACIALVAVNVAAIMAGASYGPLGPFLFELPNATFAPIILGSLAAVVLDREDLFAAVYRVAGGWLAPVAGAAALVLAVYFAPADLRGLPNLLIHVLMMFLLMTLVVREKNIFTAVLTFPAISRVGAVSYGIYLYHLLALDAVNRMASLIGLSNPWLVLFGYFVVAYLMAELSFRTLDAYFARFRQRRPQNAGSAADPTLARAD